MPERWQSELQKLRDLSAPENPPVPRRVSGVVGPSRRQRAIAVAVALLVFAGAGAFALQALGSHGETTPGAQFSSRCVRASEMFRNQPAGLVAGCPGPSPNGLPPDVGRVVCTDHETHVETPVIRPQGDGVHLLLDTSPRSDSLIYRTERNFKTGGRRGTYAGMSIRGRTSVIIRPEPGKILIDCSPDAASEYPLRQRGSGVYAPITIVDPLRLWASPSLSCGKPTRFNVHGLSGDVFHVTAPEVRRNLSGVQPSDGVRLVGYPDVMMWKAGPWFAVVRAGRTIATISFWQVHDAATVYTCASSGIAPPGHPWIEVKPSAGS